MNEKKMLDSINEHAELIKNDKPITGRNLTERLYDTNETLRESFHSEHEDIRGTFSEDLSK